MILFPKSRICTKEYTKYISLKESTLVRNRSPMSPSSFRNKVLRRVAWSLTLSYSFFIKPESVNFSTKMRIKDMI